MKHPRYTVGNRVRIVGNSIGVRSTGCIEDVSIFSDAYVYLVKYDEKVYYEPLQAWYESGAYLESQLTRL